MNDETAKVIQVALWLGVENNSKFFRGKTRVRRLIEEWELQHYDMQKPRTDVWEYILVSRLTLLHVSNLLIMDEGWSAISLLLLCDLE
jgi:hypothetical protein